MDSATLVHLFSDRSWFTTFTIGNHGMVRMRNGRLSKTRGIRDVHLRTDSGTELVLHDVKYIPSFRINLISAGKLDDEGYRSEFAKKMWKLMRGS